MAIEAAGQVINAALVLDDRCGSLDTAHADSWKEWLRLSNALALRDWPTVVTTTSQSAAPTAAPAPAPAATLPAGWAQAYEKSTAGPERDLVAALAEHGGLHPPTVGDEIPEGIMVDVFWPDARVAVELPTMSTEDRDDLEALGWRVVEATTDAVVAALTAEGMR